MQIIVLGAAAGGGLPQWNCGCLNCNDARQGVLAPMTQSSIAVSADGQDWVVLNASPDIRQQLLDTPDLHPKALRDTPIRAVVLTNGDIDHIAGMLTLREKTPFTVLATPACMDILDGNAVFNVLDSALVARQTLTLDVPVEPVSGLRITAFSVPGKVALFLEGDQLNLQEVGEQTIGLLLESDAGTVAYVPGCAALPDWLVSRLGAADVVMFDGTVWNNDDMRRTGTGEKTGARMGHIPQNGAEGSLARLAEVSARKIFVHINNTNPILQPDSPERQQVTEAGWEIAHDGMEIAL